MARKLKIKIGEKGKYKMKAGKVVSAEDISIEKAESQVNLLNLISSRFFKKGKKK